MLAVEQQDNNKEGRGASFIRTEMQSLLQSIIPLTYEQTPKPILVDAVPYYRLNAEEFAPFITPFEVIAGLAA
jgi:hypothetical protein